jgi:hypothetical protein
MKLIDLLVTYEIGMLHLFARSPKGMKMNVCAWSDPIHVRTLKGKKKKTLDHCFIQLLVGEEHD